MKVGGKSVDALLDTGTTGLRMLPGVISGALTTKGPSDRISFWSGTEFSGEVARSTISLGGISGLSEFQSIKKVECARGRPSCPAKHASLDNYGIGADGLPGEGFHALVGTKMGPSDISNPLMTIGVRRWIVELPRPGADTPGQLVLNPRDDEIADFVRIPLLTQFKDSNPLHDAVSRISRAPCPPPQNT